MPSALTSLAARCNGFMKLLSVNIGQPRLNPWKEMKLTGIDKRPVDEPVMVTPARAKGLGMVGLAGLAGAGRLDQAVHPGRPARVILPGDRVGRDPGRRSDRGRAPA